MGRKPTSDVVMTGAPAPVACVRCWVPAAESPIDFDTALCPECLEYRARLIEQSRRVNCGDRDCRVRTARVPEWLRGD